MENVITMLITIEKLETVQQSLQYLATSHFHSFSLSQNLQFQSLIFPEHLKMNKDKLAC